MRAWRKLIPNTLKNRLFAAFVVMLLLPYALLSFYNFSEVEQLMRNKISEQDQENLESVKRSLENLMGVVMKTVTLLEQDATVISILRDPGQYNDLERQQKMENRFHSIDNSLFLTGAQVYYTVVDFNRHIYTSYRPENMLDYERLSEQSWFRSYKSKDLGYQWNSSDPNYVSRDVSKSPYLITLYTTLRDKNVWPVGNLQPIGIARISIDFMQWFKAITPPVESRQHYFIVNREGAVIHQSNPSAKLPAVVSRQLAGREEAGSIMVREDSQSLYNYSYLPALQWNIVKQVPLDVLYREVNEQKRRYYTTFAVFGAAFLLVTLGITTAMTRPLKLLQKRMDEIASTELKIKLPEHRGSEEIIALSRSFNRMVRDMDALIDRLKLEERQRQAVRFQVLLSQMDPHFLLNTLNTIKCIALRNDDEETHEICVSLGKLLESSLDLEMDMIFLKDEIELLKAYMHIQNSRFGHKFTIEYEYEDALQYALVPKATLQPLVENAIYHGFATRREGRIVLRALTDGPMLVLEVEDNGAGLGKERKAFRKRKGIGIRNVRERLELLFQNRAGLELIALEHGAMARATMPLLLSTPYVSEGTANHVDNIDR
ncbi:sensor histidine kinase [Paenibacillus alkalitolerans]|uniref:sensor histidine kinase n=1 Tax=Paenibacillus alkalitolerans TaxID=2799335 RepID=UPI0018F4CD71|nr:sensor histidine kinase [Paenibacillus alkalitolerans]